MPPQLGRKVGVSLREMVDRRTALWIVAAVLALTLAGGPMVAGVSGAQTEDTDTAVDIVFVFDSSASTDEDRYHMAQQIDMLEDRNRAAGIDAHYGLVTYSDDVEVAQPLTADFDDFDRAMHFTESGNEEHASDALLTAAAMDGREDAETVIVLVTDEDDDSSNATRSEASSALSGTHFVVVSPASPAESSCSVHSPPCDNRTDNELRTMAEQVDGEWIDESQDAETIVDGIADHVATTVDVEQATPAPSRADFVTSNHSANRTTVAVGEPVRFSAMVENVGQVDGTYEAYLSHEGSILTETSTTIGAAESRTVTVVHRFDAAGEYDVRMTHEAVATVTVTDPNDSTDHDRTASTGEGATTADESAAGTDGATDSSGSQTARSGPGFGWVAVFAVLALAGAAAVIARSRA